MEGVLVRFLGEVGRGFSEFWRAMHEATRSDDFAWNIGMVAGGLSMAVLLAIVIFMAKTGWRVF
jgi:hypothetical protein